MAQLSNNTGLAVMHNLESWSWKDISGIYRILGELLETYSRIKAVAPNIKFNDQENIFLIRYQQDVKRIDAQIAALDREIARRNSLVGVIG